jgi:hypothetical protein
MANNTIGNMTAVVRASASQFDSDIKRIGNSISGLESNVNSMPPPGGFLASLKTGLGIGTGMELARMAIQGVKSAIVGISTAIVDAANKVRDLDSTAAQLGVTTQELQGLHFVFGVSGDDAGKADVALQKMMITVGKAVGGSQQAQEAFEGLGVNLDELSRMSAVDQFKAIAEAISQLPTALDRTDAATKIFGKTGVTLLDTIIQGADAIDNLIDRNKELGNELSGGQVTALNNAAVATTELSAAWEGFKNNIFAAAAPALTFVLGMVTELVSSLAKATAAVGHFFGIWKEQAAELDAGGGAMETQLAQREQEKELEKERVDAAKETQRELDALMKRGEDVARQFRTPYEEFNDTIADLQNLLSVGALNWDTYQRAVAGAAEALEKATEEKKNLDRMTTTPGIGAASRGTSAGFSAVQAASRLQTDIQKRQEQLQQQELAEARRQTELQQRIAEALARGPNRAKAVDL